MRKLFAQRLARRLVVLLFLVGCLIFVVAADRPASASGSGDCDWNYAFCQGDCGYLLPPYDAACYHNCDEQYVACISRIN